jgi:Ca2+-binding RTX toxin-like protein
VLDGGAGDDFLVGNGQTVAGYADALSAVTVDLAGGGDTGGAGTDSFEGIGGLLGSAFDDVLSGDAFANSLSGGDGNDTLNGRTGNDTLTGGAGADTFMFQSGDGVDTVTDFTHGTDVVSLHGYGFSDFATLQTFISQSGPDTVIDIDSNDIITLKGVTASTLTASDFVFH